VRVGRPENQPFVEDVTGWRRHAPLGGQDGHGADAGHTPAGRPASGVALVELDRARRLTPVTNRISVN
jgi:hypothetical protein